MEKTVDKLAELKRGVIVFLALAALTAFEYFLGIQESNSGIVSLLWVVALIKGGLVLWFFMHLGRVFQSEGGHE